MLNVVCFKWNYVGGRKVPTVVQYDARYVLILRNMVRRHLKLDHQFICVTDDPAGLDDIKTIPLWDKCRALGGCFNRLYIFSEEMRSLFGDRFVCIDLDCVIVNDITPLIDTNDDFVMNGYFPMRGQPNPPDQYYNGSMILMRTGSRSKVWDTFRLPESLEIVDRNNQEKISVGTDQAWIRHVLGKAEKRWTPADGVYEARDLTQGLPENARIVFFSGPRDPTLAVNPWIKDHYY